MAYREFDNERPYESPVIGDLPRTLSVLSQLQHQDFQRKMAEQERAAQQEKDLMDWHYSGKISQHSRAINDAIKNLIGNYLQSGAHTLTPETRNEMARIKAYQGKADAAAEELNRLKDIELSKQKEDPHYRPQIEALEQLVTQSGEGLEGIDKLIEGISNYRVQSSHPENAVKTFNQPSYLSEFVKMHGEKQNANKYTDAAGVERSSEYTSPFYDENGKPGISNSTVTEYLNGHPSAKPFYQQKAGEELMRQIEENKNSDEKWHPDESVTELLPKIMTGEIDNPNPKAKSYNQLMFDMAKNDIWNQAKVHSKLSTDYANAPQGSQYGVTSKHASASPGWNDSEITGSGPSMTVLKKDSSSPYFNFNSETSRGNKRMVDGKIVDNPYPRDFKFQSYQWGAKTNEGGVYKFNGKSADEMIKEINDLPSSAFDPKNPKAIKSASIIFNGQTVDKKTLDLAYTERKKLEAKLAMNPNDANAKSVLNKLDETLENINAGKEYNEQFLQQLLNAEITHHESFPVDRNDKNVQAVAGLTGMDVYSKKAQTPEMQKVEQAINFRVRTETIKWNAQHQEEERLRKERNLQKQPQYEKNVKKIKESGIKIEPKKKNLPLPVKGDVIDGYEFLGGDPGDQENWRLK